MGRPDDEAIEIFKNMLISKPDNYEVRYNLAFSYSQKGKYSEAAVECEKILELNAGNASVHLLLGDAYSNLGKKKEAQQEYETYKKLMFMK